MPGNAGTAMCGTNIDINPLEFDKVALFCKEQQINLVIVGPEEPLVMGIRNYFKQSKALKDVLFVGPDKEGAVIEGSKDWSKSFMLKYNIPTAAYKSFTKNSLLNGIAYIKKQKLPVVLKADGLAAGKGVLICSSHNQAEAALNEMLMPNKFGQAGNTVVVEEFLTGIECSVFVLTDGNSYKILPVAKDYKRIGEADTGLNTGGMGAVSPVPFADKEFMQRVEHNIVLPTINGLKKEGINYVGFIFIGLISVNKQPFVIEYNCRMGDPETEAVLPLITTDFVELMEATAAGKLHHIQLNTSGKCAATIMLVSKGYPEFYQKGMEITGLDLVKDSMIFHAGTKKENNKIISNGGRVIAITALGDNLTEALHKAKLNAGQINFKNKYYRTDIGYEFV